MNPSSTLTLTNDLSDLAQLEQWLKTFGRAHGVDEKTIHFLNLALDELVTNIIHYAYPDGQTHSFSLELRRMGDRIEAELIDDGVPFNPLETPEPDLDADLDSRRMGGLGIHFVRQTMDEVSYRFEQGQNRLRLVKRCATA